MCIALHRTVRILQRRSLALQLPASVSKKKKALAEIRDALEHIEERAVGRVRKEDRPEAVSIFDQRDFVSRGVLTYSSHSLDLRLEALPMLIDLRRKIFEAAAQHTGPAIESGASIGGFFRAGKQASAGA